MKSVQTWIVEFFEINKFIPKIWYRISRVRAEKPQKDNWTKEAWNSNEFLCPARFRCWFRQRINIINEPFWLFTFWWRAHWKMHRFDVEHYLDRRKGKIERNFIDGSRGLLLIVMPRPFFSASTRFHFTNSKRISFSSISRLSLPFIPFSYWHSFNWIYCWIWARWDGHCGDPFSSSR